MTVRCLRVAILVVLLAGVLSIGCAPSQSGPVSSLPKEIKFGFVSPLTGGLASSGQSGERGARFAVDKINATGGIRGSHVTMVSYDDKSVPAEAVQAVTKLVDSEKVAVIVGPLSSSAVLASMEVARKAKVPQIAYISSAPEVTSKGNKFIIRQGLTFPILMGKLAEYASKELKVKRVALMVQNDDTGLPAAIAFEEAAKKLGMEVVAKEAHAAKDQSFQGQLLKIKAANPDALMLTSFQVEAGLIVKQAREMGITSQILGPNTLVNPEYRDIGGKAVEGTVYVTNYHAEAPNATEAMKQFINAWKEKFGRIPDVYESHAYDSVMIFAKAIADTGTLDGDRLVDAILKLKDYPGVSGTATYEPNGDVVKPVVIAKIVNGQPVPVTVY